MDHFDKISEEQENPAKNENWDLETWLLFNAKTKKKNIDYFEDFDYSCSHQSDADWY